MDLLTLLIVGLIAGALAGNLLRGKGFGLIGNIIVGVIGSFIGGFALSEFGEVLGGGLGIELISATAGAVILILLVGLFTK